MIDVLIQTFNEEINLPYTLASTQGWAKNVFVVDSGSTDRTCEIARDYGAHVVHHNWEGYAAQKNWALKNLPFESDWTLILDADEAVSPQLRDEIMAIVSKPPEQTEHAGFFINRVFIFMGKAIRHCGYFPSWNLRMFKRGRAVYEDRLVHEHMIVDGSSGYLKHLMIHEDRRGLEHFFAKHNRYSSLEAREIFESPEPWPGLQRFCYDRVTRRRFGKSRILPYLPIPWIWRLVYMYILRAGFLDGRAGWYLCNFIASYEFTIQLKLRELRRLHGRQVYVQALHEPEGSPLYSEERLSYLHEQTSGEPREALFDETDDQLEPAATNGHALTEGGGIPTLFKGRDNVHRFESPWTLRENIKRAGWMLVNKLLFRTSFHNWYAWRNVLLRLFGARIGRHVRIRPTAQIEIPWNIEIGDSSVVGDYSILYSLGRIRIGRRVVISQYAHLCAGTHDYRYRSFPLLKPPITVEDEAWIAADAFVGPNVTIGHGTILGARASAFKDLPAGKICAGNPAKVIRDREIIERHHAPPPQAADPRSMPAEELRE
jgi:acetyltransferase-like isoleucine patch superfamily enzyme/glycosyltransferase involved in cell wall biosynthesis